MPILDPTRDRGYLMGALVRSKGDAFDFLSAD